MSENNNSKLSEEEKLAWVREDGYNIKYIKDPSPDIQFEAVSKTPYAIMYINNPTEDVQLMAVRLKPYAVQYIKYPTDKVIDVSCGIDVDMENFKPKVRDKIANFFTATKPNELYRPRH